MKIFLFDRFRKFRGKMMAVLIGFLCLQFFMFLPFMANAAWDVTAFGAVPDDNADDTEAIQKALDAVREEGGGEVHLPAGHYVIATSVQVHPGITLKGIWQAPHHSAGASGMTGTVIRATGGKGQADGPPLIKLEENSALKGVTIFYPEQEFPDVSPYPWAVRGEGNNVSVINVTLVNAYQGIDVGTHGCALHFIRNLFGCVLRKGIYVDQCYDIGRIENVHLNPNFWGRLQPGDNYNQPPDNRDLIDYLNEHAEIFIFGRTDWEYVYNTFAYGFDKCYKFIKTDKGACNGNFLGIGADGGIYCVWMEETQGAGLLITNGEFVSFDGIEIVSTESYKGIAQFSNCSFWGPAKQLALLKGNGSVSFEQCNFVDWGIVSSDDWERDHTMYGIQAENGTLRVTNSKFNRSQPHIHLGQEVRSAVILGNQFTGNMDLKNESSGDVQEGFNVNDE